MKQRHIIKKNYKTAAEMVAKNKAGVVALALFFVRKTVFRILHQ
jgi:hypothetical protein